MDFWVLLLSVLVIAGTCAVAYLVYLQARAARRGRARPRAVPGGREPPAADSHPFRATSIRPGRAACTAVRAIAGDRYLVRDAGIPRLPLPDCDVPQCDCIYVKYDDRRDEDEDRRALSGMRQRMRDQGGGEERRSGRERRASVGYTWE